MAVAVAVASAESTLATVKATNKSQISDPHTSMSANFKSFLKIELTQKAHDMGFLCFPPRFIYKSSL